MKVRHTWTLTFIAAVAILSATGCCCNRKGLVLRGDWSIELNRVPHMLSNGPTYGGDSCYVCGNGGGWDGGQMEPPPQQPTPAAQSRFHPVPTRPVLEPQGGP